jgi:hypothetical protein
MLFKPQITRKYDYNPDPRLSAGQLAEYLNATAPRRTSIIREAKFPKTAIVAKYREARAGVVKHLCGGPGGPDHLGDAMARLSERAGATDPSQWTIDDETVQNLGVITPRFETDDVPTAPRRRNPC